MKPLSDSKMVIRVQSLDDFAAGVRRRAWLLDHHESLPSQSGISFESSDTMLAYFTPKRVKLLDMLARQGSTRTSKLAKLVHRAPAAVARDLALLARLGTLKLSSEAPDAARAVAHPVAARYEIVYTLGHTDQPVSKRRLNKAS